MSVRVYTGPHADHHRSGGGGLRAIPWVLAALVVGLQIAWPLFEPGQARTQLTIATVVVFFLASASHALIHRGPLWTAGYLAISLGIGWGVEAVGLRAGIPFGDYAYTDALGATLLGVPWVIPLAWAMMSYPALAVARTVAESRTGVMLVGAVALASWDLFLDPMMVAAGYWTWDDPSRELPGIEGIPAINFAGWLLTSLVLIGLLDLLGRRRANDAQPLALWLWTWIGGIVANLFFLDRPTVALVGGIGMALVGVPLLWRLWVGRD